MVPETEIAQYNELASGAYKENSLVLVKNGKLECYVAVCKEKINEFGRVVICALGPHVNRLVMLAETMKKEYSLKQTIETGGIGGEPYLVMCLY